MFEDGLAAFECTIGKVRAEQGTSHAQAEVVPWDFSAQTHASSLRSK
jgi:hypothetical protein